MSELLKRSTVGSKYSEEIMARLDDNERILNVLDDPLLKMNGAGIGGGVIIVTSRRMILAKGKKFGQGLHWWTMEWADVMQIGEPGPHFAVAIAQSGTWEIYHEDEAAIRLFLVTMAEGHALAQDVKASNLEEQVAELRRQRGF